MSTENRCLNHDGQAESTPDIRDLTKSGGAFQQWEKWVQAHSVWRSRGTQSESCDSGPFFCSVRSLLNCAHFPITGNSFCLCFSLSLSLSLSLYIYTHTYTWDLPAGSVVKNLTASAGVATDLGLIPGLGKSHGRGNGTLCSIFAWKIPRTEEPGRLQSMGSQKSWT